MKISETSYLNLDCIKLQNAALSLLIPQTVLRVLALHENEGPNLFAELPHFTIPCPGAGELALWGGHRLWHAPEVARRTYLPDNQPLAIEENENGVLAQEPVEERTGLQKGLHITLPDDSPTVIVDHLLTNHGVWPVTCAPWAITQLRPGGTAVLPQPTTLADPDGLQPNRALALWPYTDMNSPHITWGNSAILVNATLKEGALKLGFPNLRGWLGYAWGETLFVKRAPFDPDAHYLDRGSSSQCYANDEFLELETLGPEVSIAPGETVTHREVWQVFSGVNFVAGETAVTDLAAALRLDEPSSYLLKG